MLYPVFDSSPRAKALIDPNATADMSTALVGEATKYGIETLAIGKSIAVPYADVQETSFRVYVSRQAKRLKRKFAVLKHAELSIYEVARIG